MGLSKTEIFTEEQNRMANIAKALGHPARLAILEYLMKSNECFCGDLVSEIGLAQATVSQHLKELKNMGIIKGEVEGTSVCYCIDQRAWEDVNRMFSKFFEKRVCAPVDCC